MDSRGSAVSETRNFRESERPRWRWSYPREATAMAATVTRIWCITASSSRRRAAMVPGLAGTVEEIDSERILESDAAPVNRVSRRAGL